MSSPDLQGWLEEYYREMRRLSYQRAVGRPHPRHDSIQGLIHSYFQEQEAVEELGHEEYMAMLRGGIEPISMDDVLDMHNFLRDFDGDFGEE